MKITLPVSLLVKAGLDKGWIKEAKWGKDVKIVNPGKWEGYTLEELRSKRDAAKARQEKRKEEGKKADPQDTSLLRELNFAIRAKTGWGKAAGNDAQMVTTSK